MRKIKNLQLELAGTPIEKIRLNPKSRDDIPAILTGLQYIYTNPQTREKLFSLLEEKFLPEVDLHTGRPGMDIWRVVVLGVVKQGLGCDYDRLHSLANSYLELRQMLGHGGYADNYEYELQTIIDNVSVLSPELLKEINSIVVESGHAVSKKKPGEGLRGRCDSFPVKTDVEYPTDVGLSWDATRCLVRECAEAAKANEIDGWRQRRHLSEKIEKLYNLVRTKKRRDRNPGGLEEYLGVCEEMARRADKLLCELVAVGAPVWRIERINRYKLHAIRQVDQIRRRILYGEVIPQEEKVFSVFEPHTRWIAKGKAGVAVEFGVPVCIVEDQYQFILNHGVMWEENDVDVCVPIIEETIGMYPEFKACSFDQGFHNPKNRKRLDEVLEGNYLPKKGKLGKKDKQRQSNKEFVESRKQHPAVESAINGLNHKGCDKVRVHGKAGFARSVALSVLATNIHRLGVLVRNREREKWRQKLKPGFAVAA